MGGMVVPMAIDKGTDVIVSPRADRRIVARSDNFPEAGQVVADLDASSPDPAWGWVNHLVAVSYALQSRGVAVHGVDVHVTGSIPPGAGLSSSASLEVGMALAFDHLSGAALAHTDIALACQQAENEFIGVACGIMDQLAIISGQQGHAIAIDCATLAVTPIPLPAGIAVVIADSKQPRELAASAYNDRRQACEAAESLLPERLVEVSPDRMDAVLAGLPRPLRAPARHVITEQARVLDFIAALKGGDVPALGRLMRASHESLRDDFEVTGSALDALAEAAWQAPGVIGARMTGAGFGGCTVNLVQPDAVEKFIEAVGSRYSAVAGTRAQFHRVAADDGAHEVLT